MRINVTNEYGRLRRVLLNQPTAVIGQVDPHRAMFESRPDVDRAMGEFWDYARLLESLDVKVHIGHDETGGFPNWLYAKDLAFVFGDRIIIANPKWTVRHGEQYMLEQVFEDFGLGDSLIRPPGYITMEGADVAWLKPYSNLLMSVGNRTSPQFEPWLGQANAWDFRGRGRRTPTMPSICTVKAHPEGVPQHIQGAFHIVDEDLIFYRPAIQDDNAAFPDAVPLDETEEVVSGYALNIVTVGPREVIMPSGNPRTRSIYASHGVRVHETPMDEIGKMSGAMACLTLALERDDVTTE